MRLPQVSPSAYRRITLMAVVALGFIIVTGGAVRLTGSGLGCPDWPTCDADRVVAPWDYHAMVEFVNRTITGLVSVAVMLAVLGSLLRRPRRRDLVWLSLGLVGGVLGQIILGGLTVLFHLAPPLVMGHFLLSMVLLADAIVLHHRAGETGGDKRTAPSVVSPELRLLGRLVVVVAGVAIFLGTVLTGAGPHGGDEDVERLPLFVPDVARLHGLSVMIFLALVLVTLWRLRRDGAPTGLLRRGDVLLVAVAAQAAVGYVQYFTGVPVVLVGVHILGATVVWATALRFLLGFSTVEAPAAGAEAPGTGRGHRAALLPSN